MKVQDFVDYHLRRFEEEVREDEQIVQVTLRLPVHIKNRADVVSEFLRVTRNSLFVAILADGTQAAFDRLKDNPVFSSLSFNGFTPEQAFQALSSGDSTAVGWTVSEMEEFVNKDVAV